MVVKRRLSAAELRAQVLGTARGMVEDAGGLTVSLAHLSLEEIIRAAGVPRSSVFREWATREDFYLDLMVELTSDEGAGAVFDQATLDTAFIVLDSMAERLRDPAERYPVAREMIRRAVGRNMEAVTLSPAWRTVASMTAMLSSLDGPGQQLVAGAIRRVEGRQLAGLVAFFNGVLPRVGLRMRPGFTVEQLAVCGSSVISGMVRRAVSAPEIVNAPVLGPGIGGEPVNWPLAGIAYLAVVDCMTEIDDNWVPPIDRDPAAGAP